MRRLLILGAAALLLWSFASGQSSLGRSNTGSLSIEGVDSVRGPGAVKGSALSLDMEFSEPSGNHVLDARETGRLRIVISNNGKTIARNVVVKLIPSELPVAVTFNDSIKVGDIPPGGTEYAFFYFKAAENVPTQVLTFIIEVRQPAGLAGEPRAFVLETKKRS
jgi:hypothetical protein